MAPCKRTSWVAVVVEVGQERFDQSRKRLLRILHRCGFTLHLQRKPSGYYAYAVKRGTDGKRHEKYIAPLYRTEDMDTEKIVAILPHIA